MCIADFIADAEYNVYHSTQTIKYKCLGVIIRLIYEINLIEFWRRTRNLLTGRDTIYVEPRMKMI